MWINLISVSASGCLLPFSHWQIAEVVQPSFSATCCRDSPELILYFNNCSDIFISITTTALPISIITLNNKYSRKLSDYDNDLLLLTKKSLKTKIDLDKICLSVTTGGWHNGSKKTDKRTFFKKWYEYEGIIKTDRYSVS